MQEDDIIACASKQLFDEVVAPELRASAKRWTSAIAEECAKIADDKASEIRLYCNEAHVVAVANAIRARFGLASPPGDDIKQD